FWLPHYTLTTAPAVILLALAGIDALCRAAGRWHSTVWVFSWLSTAGVSIAELPEFNRVHRDEFFQVTQLPEIERALAGLSDQPAVVFFRWNPGCNPEEEPVYNIERPAIDDNRVVRAHDLGPRNLTLVTYYRATQPWRRFFLYDRISGTLSPYNPEFEGAGMTDTARIEQFRKMANDDPNNELAHFSLGKALLEAGLAGEAVGSFRRAIELNPNLSKAYQLLAAAQLQISDRSAAVATLTEGVKAADRRGDSLVKNEMIATLRELGAPVPELKAAGPVVTAGEGQVHCRRCGNVGPRLAKPPFRNAFGQEIFEGTCTSCWAEAIRMGTKVINELRLPLADPQAQRIWDQHIREFLNLG
ncbi:MAG: Fe(2+)-trafficking protein, partial [Phycisphaerae bacterium]|nr:Fe(2+)-trafficking protein [Phycisphaerae bacterium]MDW8262478.1 Fe(2+)-trafficking protein [Phycisphaerales bacterium]